MAGQMCEWLPAAGYEEVLVAELGDEVILENDAAAVLGQVTGVRRLRHDTPVNGRCNLRAAKDGLLRVDVQHLSHLNLIDEAITVATLPNRHPIRSGDVVATVKIIPVAIDSSPLRRVTAVAFQGILHLAPYQMQYAASFLRDPCSERRPSCERRSRACRFAFRSKGEL